MTKDKELIEAKKLIEKIKRKYDITEQQILQNFDIMNENLLSKERKNYLEGQLDAFYQILEIISELR